MDRAELARALGRATTPDDRLAWFAALLARESRAQVEIVGGSAVEIYLTSAAHISQDIDLVGPREKIEKVLRRWGFEPKEGRTQETYWASKKIGLVHILGSADRSGLPPRRLQTPHGPVLLSAPEPLIIRRLVRASRLRSKALFQQAVALARMGALDWTYLRSEARYEKVEPDLSRLRRKISA